MINLLFFGEGGGGGGTVSFHPGVPRITGIPCIKASLYTERQLAKQTPVGIISRDFSFIQKIRKGWDFPVPSVVLI